MFIFELGSLSALLTLPGFKESGPAHEIATAEHWQGQSTELLGVKMQLGASLINMMMMMMMMKMMMMMLLLMMMMMMIMMMMMMMMMILLLLPLLMMLEKSALSSPACGGATHIYTGQTGKHFFFMSDSVLELQHRKQKTQSSLL